MNERNDPNVEPSRPLVMVMVARIPATGVVNFQKFERIVLPLLHKYGAQIDQRLRSEDGQIEVHLLRFPDRRAVDAYRNDAIRQKNIFLLHDSGASQELLELSEVVSPEFDEE